MELKDIYEIFGHIRLLSLRTLIGFKEEFENFVYEIFLNNDFIMIYLEFIVKAFMMK